VLALNSIPEVLAHQLDGVAVIDAGELGAPFTATQRDGLLPQLLLAVTHTLPVVNDPNVVLMLVEPCPLLMEPGEVQLYVVPDPCDGQLYTMLWLHTPDEVPVMLAGCVGKPGATVLHLVAEAIPHTLDTLTHSVPTALYPAP